MSVEEALGRMRLLLARRSVVARRLAAAADGPGEVRSPTAAPKTRQAAD